MNRKIIAIILLSIFTGCATIKEREQRKLNIETIKLKYPNYDIKQVKRFNYIFEVIYKDKRLRIFMNGKGQISRIVKLSRKPINIIENDN